MTLTDPASGFVFGHRAAEGFSVQVWRSLQLWRGIPDTKQAPDAPMAGHIPEPGTPLGTGKRAAWVDALGWVDYLGPLGRDIRAPTWGAYRSGPRFRRRSTDARSGAYSPPKALVIPGPTNAGGSRTTQGREARMAVMWHSVIVCVFLLHRSIHLDRSGQS